jgi:phosphohistidine phosphatase
MEIYLIRHGIALERGTLPRDGERPLTDQGREKTTQVARCLVQKDLHCDPICHSPLVRARQTAEILLAEKLGDRLWESDALAPGGNIHDWIGNWRQSFSQGDSSCLALVGHQPDLGLWAEQWVWGRASEKIILKKAGVIGIRFNDRQLSAGSGEFFLLTSPKWLI